jgi:hypothetical protein
MPSAVGSMDELIDTVHQTAEDVLAEERPVTLLRTHRELVVELVRK